jgi:hypothetical protein
MDDFIDDLGHGDDWDRIYDFNLQYPKYGDGGDLTKNTDKYFEMKNVIAEVFTTDS